MKKVLIVLVALLIMGLADTSFAQYQTATTTNPLILQLQSQLQALQAQLQALRTAQQQVQQTRGEIQQTFSLIRQLRQGMSGDDVKALQAILSADPNVYPEGLITGYYGPLTAQAVRKFQQKRGLSQVGNVGPLTLRELNGELKDNPLALEQTNTGTRPCAIVPPGHLIAPGWLRKVGGVAPVVPSCQTLPPGIQRILGTLPPATSSTTSVDVTPPVISGLSATSSASTSAVISWTTNEPSDSNVYYATSSPVNLVSSSNISNSSLVTSHSLNLPGLTASTTYYYVVGSKDAAGNTATSSEQNFTTLP